MIARYHHSKDKVKLLPYTFVLNRMKHTAYYDIKLMASFVVENSSLCTVNATVKTKETDPDRN